MMVVKTSAVVLPVSKSPKKSFYMSISVDTWQMQMLTCSLNDTSVASSTINNRIVIIGVYVFCYLTLYGMRHDLKDFIFNIMRCPILMP